MTKENFKLRLDDIVKGDSTGIRRDLADKLVEDFAGTVLHPVHPASVVFPNATPERLKAAKFVKESETVVVDPRYAVA